MKRIAHISNGYIVNISLGRDDAILLPEQLLESEALAQGFVWKPNDPLPDYKIWKNAQAFMAEFSMEEKSLISLSIDSTIAALRLELSTWFSEVHSNDDRIQTGLNKLIELNIITEARKEQICAIV